MKRDIRILLLGILSVMPSYLLSVENESIVHTVMAHQPKQFNNVAASIKSAYAAETLLKKFGGMSVRVNQYDPKAKDPKSSIGALAMTLQDFFAQRFVDARYRYQLKQETDATWIDTLTQPMHEWFAALCVPTTSVEYVLRLSIPGWEFPFHFDAYDNLFVQLQGEREIYLLPFDIGRKNHELLKAPIEELQQHKDLKPHLQRYVVQAGDALYIPAGWYHFMRVHGKGVDTVASISIAITGRSYAVFDQEFIRLYPVQRERVDNFVDRFNFTTARAP